MYPTISTIIFEKSVVAFAIAGTGCPHVNAQNLCISERNFLPKHFSITLPNAHFEIPTSKRAFSLHKVEPNKHLQEPIDTYKVVK